MLSIDILKSAPTRSILLMNAMHGTLYFADFVDHAGVKQDALSQRRFAGINMRGDSDVPRSLERELAIRRIRILRGRFLFERRGHNRHQRKCANARFACAILCVSSRFLIALPWPVAASLISRARASAIRIPLRLSAYWTIQRVAREIWRAGATSMGT